MNNNNFYHPNQVVVPNFGDFSGCDLMMVYGSMLPNYRNNYRMNRLNPIGACETVYKYAMYDSGFDFPVIFDDQAEDPNMSHIKGVLYQIDPRKTEQRDLDLVDQLEGHPSHYTRQCVDVRIPSGRVVRAWLYVTTRQHRTANNDLLPVPNGDWDAYCRSTAGNEQALEVLTDEEKQLRDMIDNMTDEEYMNWWYGDDL